MQQIAFLWYSIPVGVLLGILFDVINGIERLLKKRICIVVFDVVFGILSAVITFLSALVITDGQIHPVLLGGQLSGFLLLHFFCGKYISKGVYQLCNFFGKAIGYWHDLFSHIRRTTQNTEKCAKFKRFFKKILEIFS